jgi:hypothetical protein
MSAVRSSGRRRPGRTTDRLFFDVASSLTERDRQILRLNRWHRVLTINQVRLMFFSDRNTAQHRMTRLYQLRLVERFRPPHAGREGEYHYVLDRLGAYVVATMANPTSTGRSRSVGGPTRRSRSPPANAWPTRSAPTTSSSAWSLPPGGRLVPSW